MNLGELVVGGLQLVGDTVRRVPLANSVLPLLADAERDVLRVIRQHLEAVDSPPPAQLEAVADDDPRTPHHALRELLDQSMYTSPDDSRNLLFLELLESLVPDEARILAALSDGSAYPVVHIAEPGIGNNPTYVLENASTVGRSAGVSLPQYTSLYLTRMLRYGLARSGPEAESMSDEYDILLTDATVRSALAVARRGVRAARVVRQTVRITDLGQNLWEAAK